MKLDFLMLSEKERRLYIEQAAVRRNLSPVVLEAVRQVGIRLTDRSAAGWSAFGSALGRRSAARRLPRLGV